MISSTNSSTNAVISGSDYSVNAIGQRTGISRSGSATPASASATYGYNNRGELITADEATNAQDRAYQFDGIGNRQKTVSGSLTLPGSNNHSVNALNQYTNIPNLPATPSYDDDGNATAYPLPVNTAANAALTYDGENRLIKVVTGSTTVEYIYDSFSRRVAKTVGSTRTYYVYNGWNCVAEYTGAVHTTGAAPTPTPTYTHTWGIDLSGSMQGAGGVGGLLQTTAHGSLPTHHYPIYDGNGNITAYIDNTCSVQASFDYDPFGNITNNNNPQALPYAFSTKPRESATGLYYYGYRFYDPSTGRWINRDPIEENGGLNLYGFVGNVSQNKVDVLGRSELPDQPSYTPSGNTRVDFAGFNPDFNCAVTIIVAHYPTSHQAMIKVLGLIKERGRGELSCSKISALSCHPDKNKQRMEDQLYEDGYENLGHVFFEIPYEVNEDGYLQNRSTPEAPVNAEPAFAMARVNGKSVAEQLCRNCRCECPTVTVRFYLVGKDDPWSGNSFISNFTTLDWALYFKDIVVKCPEVNG